MNYILPKNLFLGTTYTKTLTIILVNARFRSKTKRHANGKLTDERPDKARRIIDLEEIEPEFQQQIMEPEPAPARGRRVYPRPDANTPITYGNLRKYTPVPNDNYNPYIAKAVRGKTYKRRKYSRYYPRRYYGNRGGYRGRRFRGYGAYTMDSGADFGTRWGGYLGSKLGEYVGGAAQGLVRQFTGYGDYKIKANALMPGESGTIVNPNVHGGQVFRGTEYLGDIISGAPGSFTLQSFDINAALEKTFPKLAQCMANYDQYVVEGMFFEFRSMSADALNSTNTALGQVVMACNYNVLSPNFSTKQAMEEYDGGISIKPAESCKFFIECSRSESPLDVLYTRSALVPTGADQRMYDLGNFQIATNGLQGTNVNVGELWVTYQIAGLKPKLFSGMGNYNNGLCCSNTTWTSGSDYWGNIAQAVKVDYSSGGMGLGSNFFNFPISPLVQTYQVISCWVGSGAAAWVPPTLTFTNAQLANNGSIGLDLTSPSNGSSTTNGQMTFVCTVNANTQGVFTLTGGTLPTTPTNVYLRVWQIPNLAAGING